MHMYMYLLWIEVQNLMFYSCFETKMILKNILGDPDLILAQFPYKILLFSIKLIENKPKSIKIPHFYPRQGGLW